MEILEFEIGDKVFITYYNHNIEAYIVGKLDYNNYRVKTSNSSIHLKKIDGYVKEDLTYAHNEACIAGQYFQLIKKVQKVSVKFKLPKN